MTIRLKNHYISHGRVGEPAYQPNFAKLDLEYFKSNSFLLKNFWPKTIIALIDNVFFCGNIIHHNYNITSFQPHNSGCMLTLFSNGVKNPLLNSIWVLSEIEIEKSISNDLKLQPIDLRIENMEHFCRNNKNQVLMYFDEGFRRTFLTGNIYVRHNELGIFFNVQEPNVKEDGFHIGPQFFLDNSNYSVMIIDKRILAVWKMECQSLTI